MTQEALKLALEGVEIHSPNSPEYIVCAALIEALRENAMREVQRLGQEPVTTLEDLEQEIYENTRQFVSHDVMEWMLKRYYTTPPQQEPVAWMPINTAPEGRIVLVYYKTSLGNGRIMRARYYLPETLDSDTTETGWADEGWYEESEAYEYLMPLNHEPTHWMHLPTEPSKPRTESQEKRNEPH